MVIVNLRLCYKVGFCIVTRSNFITRMHVTKLTAVVLENSKCLKNILSAKVTFPTPLRPDGQRVHIRIEMTEQ